MLGLFVLLVFFLIVFFVCGLLGVNWPGLRVQHCDKNDGTGAPSEYLLRYLDQTFRVFLTLADGRCGSSVIALWQRHWQPFGSRQEHEKAVAAVNEELFAAIKQGKPNRANAQPFSVALSDEDRQTAINSKSPWFGLELWIIAAEAFDVPIHLWEIAPDYTLEVWLTGFPFVVENLFVGPPGNNFILVSIAISSFIGEGECLCSPAATRRCRCAEYFWQC